MMTWVLRPSLLGRRRVYKLGRLSTCTYNISTPYIHKKVQKLKDWEYVGVWAKLSSVWTCALAALTQCDDWPPFARMVAVAEAVCLALAALAAAAAVVVVVVGATNWFAARALVVIVASKTEDRGLLLLVPTADPTPAPEITRALWLRSD